MLPALAALLLVLQDPPVPVQAPEKPAAEPVQEEVGPETVVASVGDVEITLAELQAEVNRQIPLNFYHGEIPVEKKREFRDKALATLIERKLILLDAGRRGLTASAEEKRAELRKTIRRAGAEQQIDEETFEQLLVQIDDDLRTRILVDKNEARFDASVPEVTEEDLRQAYEERKSHLVMPEMVRVREILMNVRPGSTEEQALVVRERLQLVLDELGKGGDFATLATIHSEHESAADGGDRGLLQVDRMRTPELRDAMKALADGEYSGMVRTRFGYHILLRERTDPKRPLEFDEVRDGLRMQVAKTFRDRAREAWMDELRDRYPVVVRDILKDAPDDEGSEAQMEPSEARAER